MPMGDKYIDLTRHLEYCGQDEIEMTFEQVANIVGGLPNAAYDHPASWSNGGYSSLSWGWLNAGFVASVRFKKRVVIFSKGDPAKERNSKPRSHRRASLDIDVAIKNIRKFHSTSVEGTYTRFRSWEHCHKAFRENASKLQKADYLSLHLAWYLASWGMLRNSFLLNMDYRVHIPVVQIILSGRYDALFADEHSPDLIPLIMKLSHEIKEAYGDKPASDTLITKIILGVYGCAPAYDRYFRNAAVKYNVCSGSWNENSLRAVWQYYEEHKEPLEKIRREMRLDGGLYPPMKLMDMCLWQIGFDEDSAKESDLDQE